MEDSHMNNSDDEEWPEDEDGDGWEQGDEE